MLKLYCFSIGTTKDASRLNLMIKYVYLLCSEILKKIFFDLVIDFNIL